MTRAPPRGRTPCATAQALRTRTSSAWQNPPSPRFQRSPEAAHASHGDRSSATRFARAARGDAKLVAGLLYLMRGSNEKTQPLDVVSDGRRRQGHVVRSGSNLVSVPFTAWRHSDQ